MAWEGGGQQGSISAVTTERKAPLLLNMLKNPSEVSQPNPTWQSWLFPCAHPMSLQLEPIGATLLLALEPA